MARNTRLLYETPKSRCELTTGERIQGNPPLLDNSNLASYSTGLYNEEGYSYCKRRTGRRAGGPSRTIAITMCDKDALEPTARWWGLPARPRGGRAITCPAGPAYRIEASGLRAELIVNEMIEFGLSRKKLEQWLKVVSQCEIERAQLGYPKPAGAVVNPNSSGSGPESSYRGGSENEQLQNREKLAFYSTGLFNGGGNSACSKKYPMIQIGMCDRDALEPAGKWWEANVFPRGDKVKVCVDGPAYRIAKTGARARLIVNEMMKCGLSGRKAEQWCKVLSQCENATGSMPR